MNKNPYVYVPTDIEGAPVYATLNGAVQRAIKFLRHDEEYFSATDREDMRRGSKPIVTKKAGGYYVSIIGYSGEHYFTEIDVFRPAAKTEETEYSYFMGSKKYYKGRAVIASEEESHAIGYEAGHTAGYNHGYHAGYDNGHDAGHDEGYDEGFDDGNAEGYDDGYNDGERDGNAAGKEEGYNDGYEDGKLDGHDDGYEEGYQAACEDHDIKLEEDDEDDDDTDDDDDFDDPYADEKSIGRCARCGAAIGESEPYKMTDGGEKICLDCADKI